MDGFVSTAEEAKQNCSDSTNPICANGPMDVMGYHTESDIPNYWSYARNFVLQDHMFTPNSSWSLPAHLFQVSGWSAQCATHDPSSCTNSLDQSVFSGKTPIYAWTDLTYLLHKNAVSWGYYVSPGNEPDCENDQALSCVAPHQDAKTPGIWNPLPYFDTVRADGELGNIKPVSNFYTEAASGTLPAVSWVVPNTAVSEHAPFSVSAGQSYVTSLVNAVMNSPDWSSTAIFVSWDDWGGFYDHVPPPSVDQNGYGLRVPGLVISPYAKAGYIDHQTLSFDAYIKFIEDDFLGGQRLDPNTDGRPDPRPVVRENVPILGDLTAAFDFNQVPIPPMLLPVHPVTTLASVAPFGPLTTAAVPGDGEATVQWGLPFVDGGSPITSYVITPYIDGVAQPTTTVDPTLTTQTVGGLANGVTYTFTVAAQNAIGVGLSSAPTSPITVGAPLAPTAPVVTPGNGQVIVQWAPPAGDNGAAVSGYAVTPYLAGIAQPANLFDSAATTQTVTGLTNGSAYAFRVAAINANGVGLSSAGSALVVPRTVPPAPSPPTATPGNASATVRWTVPSSNGGAPITGYVVTPYLAGIAQPARTFASTATTQSISALTNGKTYRFKVAAKNVAGTGAKSVLTNSVVVGAPTAPRTPSATRGSSRATVSWVVPLSNNGAAITSYVVTPFKAGIAQTPRVFNSTATTQTVSGLTNGASYTFKIAAKNARGIGSQSVATSAVIPT